MGFDLDWDHLTRKEIEKRIWDPQVDSKDIRISEFQEVKSPGVSPCGDKHKPNNVEQTADPLGGLLNVVIFMFVFSRVVTSVR